VWLTDAGYYVGHIGKFMNGYGDLAPKHIPPGYADWHAMASDKLTYTDFRLNDNGRLVRYNDGQYATDVFIQKTLDFLQNAPQPFALFLWPHAPHLPATPDQPDVGRFANINVTNRPDFNEADVSDKPAYIQSLPFLDADQIAVLEVIWRTRAECLQSLDRGVLAVMQALATNGQLANTHVIFTSDNGFFLGEHRVDDEKDLLYEEGVRVPLYWRAPSGVTGTRGEVVSNLDVTAAILELTGATAGRTQDGTSLVPLLSHDQVTWNSATLLQCGGTIGIATAQYRYMEWTTGEKELYDMTVDPYQLQNVAGQAQYTAIQKKCAKALVGLQGCAGDTCQWTGKFPHPPRGG
jgi:N-acetylglucosamine-6-sulfatase